MDKSYYPLPLAQPEKAQQHTGFSKSPEKMSLPGSPIGQFSGSMKFFSTVKQARVRR
jgi:hypothetical protein